MTQTLDIRIKGSDELTPALASAGKELSNFTASAGAKLSSVGSSMQSLGGKLSLGVTTPLAAAGFAAISLASDLSETVSKVNVIFGDQGKEMEAWANTAASAFGQSKTTALDAAATFATFGKSAGLSGEELVGFSTDFVALASDLASFNNTSPEEAINAIGSALRGEAEPMRKYGVLMDDASLKNEALKLGLIATTTDALTPQQKVLAAQALILAQTGAAQGDFARTSDGLANSQRIMTAKIKDAGAELGEKLLPIALKVVEWLTKLIDRFTNLSPTTQKWVLILGGVAAAIGPVIGFLGTLFSVIGPILTFVGGAGGLTGVLGGLGAALTVLTGPVGLVVAAVAGLALAWSRDWGGIREKTYAVVGAVKDKLQEWGSSISNWWTTHVSKLKQDAEDSGGWFNLWKERTSSAFEAVGSTISGWAGGFVDWFNIVKDKLAEIDWRNIGTDMIYGITEGILKAPFTIGQALQDTTMDGIDWLKEQLGIHSPSTLAAREIGLPFAQGIAEGVRTGLPTAMRTVTTNNYFQIELAGGGGGAASDVFGSVQMLAALYG